MALTDSDLLAVTIDTLRGLEANLQRARIMASGSPVDAEKIPVLEKQIEWAQAEVDRLQKVVPADPNSNPDYEDQTRDWLYEYAVNRGIDAKKSWRKAKLIEAHKQEDKKT